MLDITEILSQTTTCLTVLIPKRSFSIREFLWHTFNTSYGQLNLIITLHITLTVVDTLYILVLG